MKDICLTIDAVLEIWETHFEKLSPSQRKAFKLNKTAQELSKYTRKQIVRAIILGRRKYLKDILEYLVAREQENQKLNRPVKNIRFDSDWRGGSYGVLQTRICGHRYECSCLDAFTLRQLARQAA